MKNVIRCVARKRICDWQVRGAQLGKAPAQTDTCQTNYWR